MARGRKKKPFQLKLKKTTVYTFSTVVLFVLAGLILISFSRQGPFLTNVFIFLTHYFGWGTIFLPFLFLTAGLMLSRLQWRVSNPNVLVGGFLLMVSLISLTRAGLVGYEIWQNLAFLISPAGALIVLLGFVFVGFVVVFNTSLEEMILFVSNIFASFKKIGQKDGFKKRKTPFQIKEPKKGAENFSPAVNEPKPLNTEDSKLSDAVVTSLPSDGQVWEYPPLSLLSDAVLGKADRGDIKKNAETIEKNLESFGISARVVEVNLGPAVTQYALAIA